ncbi:23S rRNA (pseudouridine1915-N3)-methyltransferase [Paenibacillus sp. LBL]|uniref:DUF2487 family protein n=1 Tax=Paenibacillus sp. LBL TaxID=2940563 RepID=UPI0024750291|nr:DUF2487 family protein [Paenibacillus sp. LBL]MDH6671890.1 23S rRNA (pseudouridine1915-N3)-methyltransferase [Paenibacillus sp. LBL]
MKFSEVDEQTWEELKPFYDTCLIPYTGLSGLESPWEVTAALERLRDFMDLAEIPFKGRLVTYPAIQYGKTEDIKLLNEVCHNVKSIGFKYVVVMTADRELSEEDVPESSLVLSRRRFEDNGDTPLAAVVSEQISEMWQQESRIEM